MSTNLFSLEGRTALVTGSSRGLGRAMAEGLAAAGASIVLNGSDQGRLSSAVEEMRAAGHTVHEARFGALRPAKWRIHWVGAESTGRMRSNRCYPHTPPLGTSP